MLVGEYESHQEAELWRAWFADRNTQARQELVLYYRQWLSHYSKSLYRQYPLAVYQLEDFIHWGTVGLIEAITHYEPRPDARFLTYASHRVRGTILNQLGKATEQTAHHQHQKRRQSRQKTENRIESLGSSDETAMATQQLIDVTSGLLIGELLENELLHGSEDDSLMAQVYGGRVNKTLTRLLEGLSRDQQAILYFHYFNQLSFVEIAGVLNLSKGRVSQLHRAGLLALRAKLPEYDSLVL